MKYVACQNNLQLDNQNQQLEYLKGFQAQFIQLFQDNQNLSNQVKILTTEAEKQAQKEKRQLELKLKRQQRKVREKSLPFTQDMVQDLLRSIILKGYFLRDCDVLLLYLQLLVFDVTRSLKIKQILTLFNEYYCPIDRKKRGPSAGH